jgi:excisionase family DNA binding protein
MTEPNVLSFTEAADQRNCARSTLYRAADSGKISTAQVGSVLMIVKDEKWEEYEPRRTGGRARKLNEQEENSKDTN